MKLLFVCIMGLALIGCGNGGHSGEWDLMLEHMATMSKEECEARAEVAHKSGKITTNGYNKLMVGCYISH